MQSTYTDQIQTGASVFGSDGEKVGSVAGVGEDYFLIEKGFIFTTDVYVPMSAVSTIDEDGIRLSFTKEQVENSDWSNERGNDENVATEDSSYGTSAATDGDRLERSEERLVVDTQTEEAGAVQVGKRVVEERQAVDVPVMREEVTIERHAVDRPASAEAFTEESIEVPVYEERVEATKEARVVEELEVGKAATTETAHVEDTVRREEFEIDGDQTGRRDGGLA